MKLSEPSDDIMPLDEITCPITGILPRNLKTPCRCLYIDEAQIEDYRHDGWEVVWIRNYYAKGGIRGCFLASRDI